MVVQQAREQRPHLGAHLVTARSGTKDRDDICVAAQKQAQLDTHSLITMPIIRPSC
jgi:hypothetical protein